MKNHTEVRFILKINSDAQFNKILSQVNVSGDVEGHSTYYFDSDFRLRVTRYARDNYTEKYLIMESNIGSSKMYKNKRQLTKQQFIKYLNDNYDKLKFIIQSQFYHLVDYPSTESNTDTLMLERDVIKYKPVPGAKSFKTAIMHTTEAEHPNDIKRIETLLNQLGVKYVKTTDNMRTIVTKLLNIK